MDFDFSEALDFVTSRNSKRSIINNERKMKKRKLHYEQTPNDNELPDVISSFTPDTDVQNKITTNVENDYLLENQMNENLMEYEDNLNDSYQMENLNINDTHIIGDLSDGLECCDDLNIDSKNLLHNYTNMSTKEFCSNLLNLLRKSNICKSHANHLLSFISSTLPLPNNVPKNMENLITRLEIENNTLKKRILCTSCNSNLSCDKKCCVKCQSSNSKTFAYIYDMNIEEYIKSIYTRLKLLKNNPNVNFITFLLHLDGIKLSKSSNMKMWFYKEPVARIWQYFYEKKLFLRNPEKYHKQSEDAESSKEIVYGHKGQLFGISILQDILDISLPYSILIDYQHVTLLRHTKTVLNEIYKLLKPSKREQLNNKLRLQSFPHFFHRKMKPFTEFAFIKATELRNILYYGCLPSLLGLIDIERLAHFALFVCSIRLYHLQPSMFDNQTQTIADALFDQYYKDHELFYTGIQNFVLHLHRHFGAQYRNYGSLANIGCFHQEDLIGHISKNIHGSNYYSDLIVHYYSIDFHLYAQTAHAKFTTISKPIDLNVDINLNNYPIVTQYHDKICTCLNPLSCVSIYRRFLIRNNMFHSLIYNKRGKSNSYFVSYYKSSNDHNQHFGRIKLFFTFSNSNYALLQRYIQDDNFSSLFETSSYFSLLEKPLDKFFSLLSKESSDLIDIIDVNNILKHCITFEFHQQLIVTEVSAYHEHD
ncbi:hypothetical protein I4U23_031559 [Adineta vaga]|nr:hypothetical protein I4U23_031559 [Adineta vaga]